MAERLLGRAGQPIYIYITGSSKKSRIQVLPHSGAHPLTCTEILLVSFAEISEKQLEFLAPISHSCHGQGWLSLTGLPLVPITRLSGSQMTTLEA